MKDIMWTRKQIQSCNATVAIFDHPSSRLLLLFFVTIEIIVYFSWIHTILLLNDRLERLTLRITYISSYIEVTLY